MSDGLLKKKFNFRLEIDPTGKDAPWWMSIVSVVLALLVCGLFIQVNGMDVIKVYTKMFTGAFGSTFGFTETLIKAIPLLLCGLGVSVAYKISVWNIGAEGQFIAGAMAATGITIYFPNLQAPWSLLLMMVAGILAGALWGAFTALPRVYFHVNELISSLMLNYVALLALNYVIFGPWKDPKGYNFPGSPIFTDQQSLWTFGNSRVHFGLILALIGVVLYAVLINYTRWGYELRLLGANPEAAKNAGINIKKQIILVMLISGGLAGLAGMSEVSGVAHRLMYGLSPGYGYTAIIVAWLAKLNPFGLIISSVLFGGLIVGGFSVQTLGLPSSISVMIQGAVLFFLIGGNMVGRLRLRRTV